MKKAIVFLLVITMLLAVGCGKQQPEPTEAIPEATVPATEAPTETPTEAPTEAPTEPQPVCTNATVQIDKAPAVMSILNRGDLVDVVGEYEEKYYVVMVNNVYGFIEKQLLRMETEEAYEPWNGYAGYKAAFYSNYQLQGEPVQTMKLNTKVQVLDELDSCYVVQVEDVVGYIAKSSVNKYRITGGGSSGGGGGSSSSSGSSGGQDGGDITLRYGFVTLSTAQTAVTGRAQVLADGAQFVLALYNIGDAVSVVTEEGFAPTWEGYHTVYAEGIYAYIPKSFVLTEGEEAYAQWEGYCGYKALIYDNYQLHGEGKRLSTNTKVTVLWDGGSFYLVSTKDGLGYLSVEQVRETRYSVGSSSGGGSSSSGSSGGDEWSPPVL